MLSQDSAPAGGLSCTHAAARLLLVRTPTGVLVVLSSSDNGTARDLYLGAVCSYLPPPLRAPPTRLAVLEDRPVFDLAPSSARGRRPP